MSRPLVSVIVPVYNAERYLADALKSLFMQTYGPIEVITVDDGSSDGSPDLLAALGDRIVTIRQVNQGPAAARNTGLARARGEFIAFLDADDRLHAGKIERQMAQFEADPSIDVSVCVVENFWDGNPAEEAARLAERQLPKQFRGVVMQAVLARRILFDRIGAFNPGLRFCEDTDWYLRAAEAKVPTNWIDEVLVYRRVHDRNMTREFPAIKTDMLAHVYKASIDRIRQRQAMA